MSDHLLAVVHPRPPADGPEPLRQGDRPLDPEAPSAVRDRLAPSAGRRDGLVALPSVVSTDEMLKTPTLCNYVADAAVEVISTATPLVMSDPAHERAPSAPSAPSGEPPLRGHGRRLGYT